MAKVTEAHLEARRRSILDAASRVFSEKGVAGATMAEIAREAGLSAGAIYRYFASKEDLARGCLDASAEAVNKAWLHPELVEMGFTELSEATFAALERPEAAMDTRLWLEQVLTAVREGDATALKEFREEYGQLIEGIGTLLRRSFGERLEGYDVHALAQALHSFYWGARLMHLLLGEEAAPMAQLKALQGLMAGAMGEPGAR
ncbi:helix-turn-helix domain-containing protein [Tepidiforma sp.]|uniref:helix-turn-helix domain-containing protein n=1 Tax=Tepidiforma sp. TaxID=2682230 RepID=UPI002ADD8ABD|nr:helix-turn-helix domain-containing protein [Tepidiforma sp.]